MDVFRTHLRNFNCLQTLTVMFITHNVVLQIKNLPRRSLFIMDSNQVWDIPCIEEAFTWAKSVLNAASTSRLKSSITRKSIILIKHVKRWRTPLHWDICVNVGCPSPSLPKNLGNVRQWIIKLKLLYPYY